MRILKTCLVALALVWGAPAQAVDPVAPERAVPMFIGLAPVTDWGAQQPFIDVMKTARPWIGHLPGRWGGVDTPALAERGLLGEDGWPLSVPGDLGAIGTILLTDLPEDADTLAGRYVLRFEGSGIVEVSGRASSIRYGPNRITFDFTPGPGGVEVKIQRSDPRGTGDHVRNITVMREDFVAAHAAGAVFNPLWLDRVRGFQGLRFMDWMATNNSTLSSWDDRPRVTDYTYAWRGVPVEVMVAVANELQADAWFTLPHLADDRFARTFAETVFAALDPGLRVYAEFSNEVWNWQFTQARWADEVALQRWGARDTWVQAYAMRAAQVAGIWDDVFAGADRSRLVTVISSQTGWLGLEDQILNAPLWVGENPDLNPPPHLFFDAYAVTGYFAGTLGLEGRRGLIDAWVAESRAAAEAQADAQGLTGTARTDYLREHRFDLAFARAAAEALDGRHSGNPEQSLDDVMGRILPYHAAIAAAYNLELVMYEGGTHAVGLGALVEDAALTDFLTAFNYSAGMGALYSRALRDWSDLTTGPFNVFVDVYVPNRWGSWGALRHVGDDNPRWDAIMQFRNGPGDDG